jgi:hypothetical protein
MAIPPGGTFDYVVVMKRDPGTQSRWSGEGRSMRDSSIHPGMFGKRPVFELEHGRLLLRATESKLSMLINRHFRWQRPADPMSFEVGSAPAVVMEQGDRLFFHRFGTGDYALVIMRGESLVLATGSCAKLRLGTEIQVDEDERLAELDLYYLAEDLDKMDDVESQVVWIDVGEGDLEAQIEMIEQAPRCEHLVVAIKEGEKRTTPHDLYERIISKGNADRISYLTVDLGFPNKQAWIGYLKQLLRGRPKDLHVSFTTEGNRIDLCEGEEAFIGAYFVRVELVYRRGLPGELSSLAIGRMSCGGLTKDMVVESARLLKHCR